MQCYPPLFLMLNLSRWELTWRMDEEVA